MASALSKALAFFKVDEPEPDIGEVIRSNVSLTRKGSISASQSVNSSFSEGKGTADYEILKNSNGAERIPSIALSQADKDRWERLGRADLRRNLMSEAVVGSLPTPLSFTDKQTIRNSVPKSPTLDVISTMKSDFLAGNTPEAQKRRLRLLSGSVVVIICAGYSGKRFVYEKAKKLGVRLIMVDGPECWAKQLEAEGIVEKFVALDFSDPAAVFDKALEIIKDLRKEYGNLDGITSYMDMAMPLVARLCDALGYPGNSAESVEKARDKHKTRAALETAQVPTPASFLIQEESQLEAAAQKVGFPAVLKPISGAASLGVVRVDNLEDMRKCYKRIQNELSRTIYKDGAIITADEGQEVDTSQSKALDFNFTLMLEEYLDGPEVDVDVVLHDGRMAYSTVVDNWPTEEPWFLETGSNAPSILSAKQQQELKEMAQLCITAMGLSHGVLHVELKYTSRGPRLIEVNARMGGGCVRDENLMVTGVDLVEEQLIAAIGLPNNPPVAAKPLNHLAEYSINAPVSGVINDFKAVEAWQDHPDVVYCRPLCDVGAKVVSSKDGLPTWIAEVMVTKPTVEEAITFVKQVNEDIVKKINITPATTGKEE